VNGLYKTACYTPARPKNHTERIRDFIHNNVENIRQLEKSGLNVSCAADETSTQEEGKGG
jgi:hypothetical protein